MSSDSSDVFLAPCDPENFDRTVRSSVDLGEYPDHPNALSGRDDVRFWGARVGSKNQTYFEKMDANDLVLFYQDGQYVGTGWIGTTFEDEAKWASTNFWQNAPSQLVYTVENFTRISISKATVNGIFDYDGRYSPQGLMRVADGRVEKRPAAIKVALERYNRR